VTSPLFEQYKAALRRGHLAALAGELDAALAAYDEAGRLAPDRPLPLASRGTVLHRLDRWPEAAAALDQALQLAPDDEAALRARATARAERGLRSGAAADYERLAFVLDVAGRSPEAADAARLAAELEPSASRKALAQRLGAATEPPHPEPAEVEPAAEDARAAAAAEGELEAAWTAMAERATSLPGEDEAGSEAIPATAGPREPAVAPAAAGDTAPGDDDHAWPGIDLPSPPPPPVDARLDAEALLAEAALVLESGEVDAARDLMLTAIRIHRDAGRIDSALEVCLNLLSIAPGDPRVHLALANLQLDRGWTPVATEKLDLLARLTSLTGDTQAAADVRGLASERLRDEPAARVTGG
jgi:tetratricopeptide (TPR) repeat protein